MIDRIKYTVKSDGYYICIDDVIQIMKENGAKEEESMTLKLMHYFKNYIIKDWSNKDND